MRWFPPRRPPSANFTWGEVITRSGYDRVPLGPLLLPGLGWKPVRVVFPRLSARRHARNLERLRARVNELRHQHDLPAAGIRILSWARSYTHNRQVGGASDSQHLYFCATDIPLEEIRRLCPWPTGRFDFDHAANAVFANGGFGQYPLGARHVDSRGFRARWTSWTPGRRRRH